MATFIGVDIGGTTIHSALCSSKKILKRATIKTGKGKKEILSNILKAIREVYSKDIKWIGIGCPGPLNTKTGLIGNTPHLPLNKFNLLNFIKKEFKKKVLIENDANCFLLGEYFFTDLKKMKNVMGLTLGTGVGGGVIINKQLYRGRGNAGELGHMVISSSLDLEKRISTKGIMDLCKNTNVKNPEELYELAKKGNKKAINVWKKYGTLLGAGITSLVHCFDPDAVVIGGQISNAWQFFEKDMKKEIKKRCLFSPPRILKSKLGKNAGVLGAAALAMK